MIKFPYKEEFFKQKEHLLKMFKGFMVKYDNKRPSTLRKSKLLRKTYIIRKNNRIIIEMPRYAINVDKGRKKESGKVPIDALIRFIKENNIGDKSSNINSLAFAIQNQIYKEGIAPRRFLKPSYAALKKEVRKIVNLLIERRLNRL